MVDVNVHPAKREVRFSREFEVIAAVRNAVTRAMREADDSAASLVSGIVYVPVPEQSVSDQKNSCGTPGETAAGPIFPGPLAPPEDPPPVPSSAEAGTGLQKEDAESASDMERILKSAFLDYRPQAVLAELRRASELPGLEIKETKEDFPVSSPSAEGNAGPDACPAENPLGLRIIGILNNAYIIAEKPEGLILIDQHAAHERILFEKILKGVDGTLSQRLLIPITLEMSRAEIIFIRKNIQLLEKIGFEAEPFGANTIKLNAIPAALSQENAGRMFKDMLTNLTESGSPGENVNYEQIAMCACKAAVKANDRLSMEEAVALLRQLSYCDLPFACPHGRPTVLNISMKEIERRFGRR